jgi:hypothetical protein
MALKGLVKLGIMVPKDYCLLLFKLLTTVVLRKAIESRQVELIGIPAR